MELISPVMVTVTKHASFAGGGVGTVAAGAYFYGREQDVAGFRAGADVVTEDALGVSMFAVVERPLSQPAEGDFGFHDLNCVFAASDFVAVGATVEGNDMAGGGLAAAAAEEDVIFECGAGESALFETAHLSIDVTLECAAFGGFQSGLGVVFVLEREAAEECFDEFDFAMR